MSSKWSTDDTVLVGRVRRPHGVRGAVIVESLTDNPERWAAGSRMLAGGDKLPAARELTVEQAQDHGGGVLVFFAEAGDREAAEALRGAELAVPLDEVPPTPDGTWYEFELVGCRCHDRAAGDLGEVVDVVEDGGGLLLIVDDGLRRLPIPFVRAFLVTVDVGGRRIDVDLPPGLIEACASGS